MNTAYVKETGEYITVQQYKDELHRLKIYCPECCEAPLHIVRQQKKTFFRVNNKKNIQKVVLSMKNLYLMKRL